MSAEAVRRQEDGATARIARRRRNAPAATARRARRLRCADAPSQCCSDCSSGCTVGPDYGDPKSRYPATYLYRADGGRRHRRTREWWKQFDDPVLDQLIVEALANNKNVHDRRGQRRAGGRRASRSALAVLSADRLPGRRGRDQRLERATSCAAAGHAESRPTSYQALAGASWEIDLWGRIRRQTEAAQANLLATRGGAPRRDAVAGVARSRRPICSCARSTSSSRSRSARAKPTPSR